MYHLVEIVPKFSSGISIGGSLAVIQDVLLDPSKRQTTYHRLVLGISVSDVLSSTVFLISSWIKPTDNIPSKACQSFGFVGQLGNLGATLYNVVLMTYYLLMLKFRWNTLQLKNIEPFLHGFAIITTTTVAILGAVKGIYAYYYYVCWYVAMRLHALCVHSVPFRETTSTSSSIYAKLLSGFSHFSFFYIGLDPMFINFISTPLFSFQYGCL